MDVDVADWAIPSRTAAAEKDRALATSRKQLTRRRSNTGLPLIRI